MATIQLKRRITGIAVAPPATTNAGEPFFSKPGFTGGGPNALYIDDGTNVIPLVDSNRQVELAGAQIITGVKTVSGAGAMDFAGVANILMGDGVAGQALVKGAAGNAMAWATLAAGDFLPMTGGTLTGPLILDADPTVPLGAATKAYVDALQAMIAQLEGVMIYAGSYDATTNEGTFNGQGGIAAGTSPLPAAAAANQGAYVIVTAAGPGGVPPEPAGPISVQDWLVSDGTAWNLLTFGASATTITAANVSVTPTIAGADDVQEALTVIYDATQVVDGLTF